MRASPHSPRHLAPSVKTARSSPGVKTDRREGENRDAEHRKPLLLRRGSLMKRTPTRHLLALGASLRDLRSLFKRLVMKRSVSYVKIIVTSS